MYKIGDELYLEAWWKQNEPVLCKIIQIYNHLDGDVGLMVKPLEGNPHMRYIHIEKKEILAS